MKLYTFSEKLPKLLKEAFQESGDANDAKMTYGKTQIIYIYKTIDYGMNTNKEITKWTVIVGYKLDPLKNVRFQGVEK